MRGLAKPLSGLCGSGLCDWLWGFSSFSRWTVQAKSTKSCTQHAKQASRCIKPHAYARQTHAYARIFEKDAPTLLRKQALNRPSHTQAHSPPSELMDTSKVSNTTSTGADV